jgi:Domain of unknown function (DUF4430)
VRVALAAVAFAVALTGCSSAGAGGGGRATVWVTKDRGTHVVLVRTVPAGLTAMQALDRVADLKTRYAGRFVQAIDGIEGSLSDRHDWFYFVNGYEADRSAAEYRLRRGDVEWWDYRSWKGESVHVPVVVGAFPEPFLHGFDGERRPVVVAGPPGAATRRIAHLVHADRIVITRGMTHFSARGSNVLTLVPSRAERFRATATEDRPGAAVEFTYRGDLAKLARDPAFARFRYAIP